MKRNMTYEQLQAQLNKAAREVAAWSPEKKASIVLKAPTKTSHKP